MILRIRLGNTVIPWYPRGTGPGSPADTKICRCSKSLTVSPLHLQMRTHRSSGPAVLSCPSVWVAFFSCQSRGSELRVACCARPALSIALLVPTLVLQKGEAPRLHGVAERDPAVLTSQMSLHKISSSRCHWAVTA